MSGNRLRIQAAERFVLGLIAFGLLLFVPAGTFNYWQAWVFLAVFTATSVGPSVFLLMKHPEVLRRRMRAGPMAETRPVQRFASSGIVLLFAALLVISALDHRHGWSPVPAVVSVGGDALVALGLGIAMLVVVQNSYAAATITVEADQKVVSTGLYGFVRHPMYFGALIMWVGISLALDSYWGLATLIPVLIVLAARIMDEEKVLREELAGYSEYTQKVRHRLVPYVW
jgi:protein-S-isoprenylcysteine O-methyltransferase Ste14